MRLPLGHLREDPILISTDQNQGLLIILPPALDHRVRLQLQTLTMDDRLLVPLRVMH